MSNFTSFSATLNSVWSESTSDFTFPASVSLSLLSLLVIVAYWIQSPSKVKDPLPPGPPRLPLLGNLFQLGEISKFPWLKFTEWSKQYGPIIYLNMLGQPVVVLNTAQAAFDLLDQRGTNYTDRPKLIMAAEILAGNIHVGFVPHGPLWRKLRKAAHMGLNLHAAEAYFPIQEREATLLVKSVLENPSDWDNHLQKSAASTILSIVYGTEPLKSREDPIVLRINHFMERMLKAALPGNYMVDMFPVLNKLPPWLAKFKREGMAAHKDFTAMFSEFLQGVKGDKFDTSNPTFSATVIKQQQPLEMSEKEAAWLAGAMFGAGSDTTGAALAVFTLAMILYPDVLKKAQAEVDSVVGRDRLPTFADRDQLPYIRALVKEVLRWKPITPLGLARRAVEDDVYQGYFIPAGSIVMTNVWAMNLDTDIYENPTEFVPERYLTPDGRDYNPQHTRGGTHAYGFGRRICAGMNVANNSLFIDISRLLWAFNFTPSTKTGLPSPDAQIDTGVVVRPAPFECEITPRAPNVQAILDMANEV
ncbi:hypothetical protein QCA50_013238 [Cerrena zonata]|uniref:Cytochrome P450 n=1 Tax=Cerrena zonata TaxID=2478898 RepID=A0AAW0G468_9APHY